MSNEQSNKYPKLMRFSNDNLSNQLSPSDENDLAELSSILDDLSFNPSNGCLICANALKNNDLIYLNRKGEIYHYSCYNNAIQEK